MGKKLFTLLSTCFPENNKLHKIINKNTIKLSYSCKSKIKQNIVKKILNCEKVNIYRRANKTMQQEKQDSMPIPKQIPPSYSPTDQHKETRQILRKSSKHDTTSTYLASDSNTNHHPHPKVNTFGNLTLCGSKHYLNKNGKPLCH